MTLRDEWWLKGMLPEKAAKLGLRLRLVDRHTKVWVYDDKAQDPEQPIAAFGGDLSGLIFLEGMLDAIERRVVP